MMKKIFSLIVLALLTITTIKAQKTDSVIIKVGEKSKVIFAIGDKADLQTLKQYNFQAVVDDLVTKLEQQDSTKLEKPADTYLKAEEQQTTQPSTEATITREYRERDRNSDDWDRSWDDRQSYNEKRERQTTRYYGRRTHHSFNFDLGINNFLTSSNSLPDYSPYSVRPWGSWYVAVNSIERTRISRKFFMEWGIGVSWYNFKFENDKLRISKDANTVIFSDDQRDVEFIKSKLTATYLNASLVPVIDFGGRSRKPMFFNGGHNDSFRIGLGPYAGYRIDSYSKLVFKDNGDKHRERDHDNYYLNNLRYGLRLQFGFGATDFFVNYDMNEVFASGKGPKLHAFSFGLTF